MVGRSFYSNELSLPIEYTPFLPVGGASRNENRETIYTLPLTLYLPRLSEFSIATPLTFNTVATTTPET